MKQVSVHPVAAMNSSKASNARNAPNASSAANIPKSRQVKALIAKTLNSQKRAITTNVVCVILCPLAMVAICSALGTVISALLQRSSPIAEILYCSNMNAMNSSFNLPILNQTFLPNTSSVGYSAAGATRDVLLHANYALVRVLAIRNPGAASSGRKQPCTFWFGEDYPYSSTGPYDINPNPSNSPNFTTWSVRDSMYVSQPILGWFNAISAQSDDNIFNFFTQKQLLSKYIYTADSSISTSLLGNRLEVDDISISQFLVNAATNPNKTAFVSPSDNSAIGILGTIPTRYWFNFSLTGGLLSSSGFKPTPLYTYNGTLDETLDDSISSRISSVLTTISKVDKSVLVNARSTVLELVQFFLKLNVYLNELPYGAIHFANISHLTKKYEWIYHIGFDKRFSTSTSFAPMGVRQLQQQTALDNGILRNGNISSLGRYSITQGFRAMPQVESTKLSLAFDGIIGGILYPFGVSFLFPIFVVTLVTEKEKRISIMMKMNGLKESTYFLAHYLTFLILYAISSTIFIAAGYGFKLTLFTQNSMGIIILLFFLWGNCQIILAFLFSTFFKRSRLANISMILVVLCSVIVSLTIDDLFPLDAVDSGYFIWPPFAFYRALGLLNRHSFYPTLRPFTTLVSGSELSSAINALAISFFIYGLLYMYFIFVIPQEFGSHRPWHFPVTDIYNYFEREKRKKLNQGNDPLSESNAALTLEDSELKSEDADVKLERSRVLSNEYDPKCPVIMKQMRKVYPGRGGSGPKLAVKDVTLAIEEGIVFGLLGPNGAGKTTLISILTGLYDSSYGIAKLAGLDIKTEIDKVYRVIGVCPQFDILWDDLTIEEHLYFYARVKGVTELQEKAAVNEALKTVDLEKFRFRLTNKLSGGEKRRLSIAIALIGNPSVIFFDEPTTGLDPEVRRLIWDIVSNSKAGKTIILTTHSMEEAEALCQRIGIMAKGTLRCLGNPMRLKELYGAGFKLFFNCLGKDSKRASEFVESLLPDGWSKVDSFATNVSYEFPLVEGSISLLFSKMELGKAENGILDWGLGQTTLEEVFMQKQNINRISKESTAAVAEIYSELNKLKSNPKIIHSIVTTPLVIQGKPPPKPTSKPQTKDYKINNHLNPTEEIVDFEASYISLQRKSQLYEKLQQEGGINAQGQVQSQDDLMVDFLAKELPETESMLKNPARNVSGHDDPWIETIDEFGRTRLCRKSALLSSKTPSFVKESDTCESHSSSMVSSEILRQQDQEQERLNWEQEMRSSNDPVHYDTSKEIRNMGTAHYKFSKDEIQRLKELQELRDLREKTIIDRESILKKSQLKKRQLEDRKRLISEKNAKRQRAAESKTMSQVDDFLSSVIQDAP